MKVASAVKVHTNDGCIIPKGLWNKCCHFYEDQSIKSPSHSWMRPTATWMYSSMSSALESGNMTVHKHFDGNILILSILVYCGYTMWVHQDIKSATAHDGCMCMQIGLVTHGIQWSTDTKYCPSHQDGFWKIQTLSAKTELYSTHVQPQCPPIVLAVLQHILWPCAFHHHPVLWYKSARVQPQNYELWVCWSIHQQSFSKQNNPSHWLLCILSTASLLVIFSWPVVTPLVSHNHLLSLRIFLVFCILFYETTSAISALEEEMLVGLRITCQF